MTTNQFSGVEHHLVYTDRLTISINDLSTKVWNELSGHSSKHSIAIGRCDSHIEESGGRDDSEGDIYPSY